jgi:hypothetical protein
VTLTAWIFQTLTAPTAHTRTLVATRVYPKRAPKNAAEPYVVQLLNSAEDDETFCGPTGLTAYGVEFEIRSKDDAALDSIEGAILADLRETGKSVFRDTASDSWDPEPGLHLRSLQVTVWYQE